MGVPIVLAASPNHSRRHGQESDDKIRLPRDHTKYDARVVWTGFQAQGGSLVLFGLVQVCSWSIFSRTDSVRRGWLLESFVQLRA